MENLHVKFEGEGNTFTLLQGKALEQKPPEKIIITGDIKTVSNFLRVRKTSGSGLQEVDLSKAVILVDKNDLSITLNLDPENHYGVSLKGKLELSDELLQFHINKNKTFTKEELVKLIKFNKINFDEPTKHSELLLSFQKISSNVNIRANESADDRGNKERAFVKDVTTNTPTEFILNIPIFKNHEAVRFRVEICLDVTEGSVRFWFESVELHELIQSMRDQIFNDQLKDCEGFVIINR